MVVAFQVTPRHFLRPLVGSLFGRCHRVCDVEPADVTGLAAQELAIGELGRPRAGLSLHPAGYRRLSPSAIDDQPDAADLEAPVILDRNVGVLSAGLVRDAQGVGQARRVTGRRAELGTASVPACLDPAAPSRSSR